MNRRMTAMITILCLMLTMPAITGCSAHDSQTADTDTADRSDTTDPDSMIRIMSNDGKDIAEINSVGDVIAVPGNRLFYSQTNDDKTICSYHLLDTGTNKDTVIGTIDNPGYEAYYARTYLNGRIYTLVETGDIIDNKPDPLWLLEFDLSACSTKEYKITDNGFPYVYMAPTGDKIIIVEHDQQDVLYDRVKEFDPATGDIREIMNFELSKDISGDTLRAVCSTNDKVYLLRIHCGNESAVSAYIDEYDLTYSKTAEYNITDIITDSLKDTCTAADINNEMMQMVSSFKILDDGCFYYENFSSTRCIGNYRNGTLIYGMNDLFNSVKMCDRQYFYTMYPEKISEGIDGNSIYEFSNGRLSKVSDSKIPLICDEGHVLYNITVSDGKTYALLYDTAKRSYLIRELN